MSQYISDPEEVKELYARFRLFHYAIAFTALTLMARLWYLQIIEGSNLREFSEKNRIKQVKMAAPRGLVTDREGRLLIENHPGFEAFVSPQYIEDLKSTSEVMGRILELDPAKIEQKIIKSRKQNGPFVEIKIKSDLSREEVFRLKRARIDLPGVDIKETTVRFYPLGPNGSQLFGYVGEISKSQLPIYNRLHQDLQFDQGDLIGKSGLEELLERDLRGTDGVQFLQVDAFGRKTAGRSDAIYGENFRDVEPEPGLNVQLTIDMDLQIATWKSFAETHKRLGGAVMMKSNGEILAWVNFPSFDPNDFSTKMTPGLWSQIVNDPFKPLRNKVIQDTYPPGSTFKAFVAIAGIQEKVITPTSTIFCSGVLQFGKRPWHDHLKGGHGAVNVFDALERSCNIFFFKLGSNLGIDRMHKYISKFGLGAKTGIDLNRENGGLLPSDEWKRKEKGEPWMPGENLSVAIGGGSLSTTPLQLAVGYNAIGLEGIVVRPFVLKEVKDLNDRSKRKVEPLVLRNLQETQPDGTVISESTFKIVKEGLRRVVNGNRGTAIRYKIPGVEIAGKTGTAQVRGWSATEIHQTCENLPLKLRHHGWFIAYAPADKPEVAVAVLAEHSCHGGSGAGIVAKDMFLAYFQKYHPDLLKEAEKKMKAPVVTPPPDAPEE